ncbi:MAG TPA: class I SAM-dependent methyltransferase [Candidatus Limnocylindrales bacterium]|nr:class I SAM-dependent methyltransferase [Candidatus Limnocylindrales bacterium]
MTATAAATKTSMVGAGPQEIVAAGYDAVAERYLAWSPGRPSGARRRVLELADSTIPRGVDVLELGCGAGVPMTATLARGRRLTGVDLSATQIALARRNVPAATFLQADLTTLERPAASEDAVVAFYVLTHVPREELANVLARIRTWLRPGGVFLAAFGVEDDPGTIEPDWLGVPMFFSHFSARVNRRLVTEAGFEIEWSAVLREPEDRFDARFLWILARAPGALR